MKELLSNPRFYVAMLFVSVFTVWVLSGVIENRKEPRKLANILNFVSGFVFVGIIFVYIFGACAGWWKW